MRLYFDYAASTPVDPRVEAAMRPYFLEKFGNPGSLHSFGQEAIAAVDKSREIIARALGADFREIIFTGSATEANNLALRGAVRAAKIKTPRIIVSSIEHESILETARDLEKDGVEVIYLPVDRRGIVNFTALKKSLNNNTILVSVMYANNEIGTIQPISEISKIISEFKKNLPPATYHLLPTIYPLLHTDAAQAFQFLDCDVGRLGVDMLTISGQKIYGPKGVGTLYVKNLELKSKNLGSENSLNSKSYILSPQITGGGQEFGLRSATENVPTTVGFAKAVELADSARDAESKRIAEARDFLWQGIKKIYPEAKINGSEKDLERIPHILNIHFPGYRAEDLLTRFDLAGIAASAGSACRARAIGFSYVIDAMGFPERAKASIRFSFGRPTTKEEISITLKIIETIFKENTDLSR